MIAALMEVFKFLPLVGSLVELNECSPPNVRVLFLLVHYHDYLEDQVDQQSPLPCHYFSAEGITPALFVPF